jgi:hypothetical protein
VDGWNEGSDVLDFKALRSQLITLEERYQAWVAPINAVIQEKLFLVNRAGYTYADYERDLAQVREAQRARYDPYSDMYALFDRLCPAYLDAPSAACRAIRDAVADKPGVLHALLGYVYRAAKLVRSPGGAEWLLRGVAAASIENGSRDVRDLLLALAELYVAAEEAGIPPRSAFRKVAALSSGEIPKGGNTPVRDILAHFHRYGALHERRRRGSAGTPDESTT